MSDDEWASSGPDDRTAGSSTVPAFIEVEPENFKPIEDCTAGELRAVAQSKMIQARALLDEAHLLLNLADTR